MELIYPEQNAKIYVPLEIDGKEVKQFLQQLIANQVVKFSGTSMMNISEQQLTFIKWH